MGRIYQHLALGCIGERWGQELTELWGCAYKVGKEQCKPKNVDGKPQLGEGFPWFSCPPGRKVNPEFCTKLGQNIFMDCNWKKNQKAKKKKNPTIISNFNCIFKIVSAGSCAEVEPFWAETQKTGIVHGPTKSRLCCWYSGDATAWLSIASSCCGNGKFL